MADDKLDVRRRRHHGEDAAKYEAKVTAKINDPGAQSLTLT